MLTGGILALSIWQPRHGIRFCGYLLGKAFFLSKPAQECSKFKQLLTTRGVQEFSGWFFFFSWGAGRWVSTIRHSIGKLAVKLTHLFVIWMEGPSVGGTCHLPSRGCQVSPLTLGIVVIGCGRKAVPSSFHTLQVGQQFLASVFECFLSYFPSLIFNNARKTELQNKMYSGFFHCENIDILSTSPLPSRKPSRNLPREKCISKGETIQS